MSYQHVIEARSAEKAAKDAFYAVHCLIRPGDKVPANYKGLKDAMVAATKARMAAVLAYSATL